MASDGSSRPAPDRCRCGHDVESGHQFCSSCGRPVGAGAGHELDPSGEPMLLLGRAGGPSMSETTVRTGPGLTPRLVGIGLALVGAVLMWTLFRQPTSEVAPDRTKEEAVADTEPDGAAEDDDAVNDAAEDDDEPEEEEDGPTTTTGQGSTSSDPSETGTADGPSIPVLGEETGLMLAISQQGQPGLRILDLDSGEVVDVRRQRSRPVGVIDRWLIVVNESDGATIRVDLQDLEAEPVRITDSFDEFIEVVEITEDRIWTIGESDDATVLRALDIDGQLIEERDFPIYSAFGYGPWSLVRPSELVYDPAGGLYRRSEDGEGTDFELVAEGQVLAAGDRIAVIRQCDDGLDCQLRWYDIRSSGVIGFPSPPPAAGQGFYQLLGGDRWLAYFDWRSGQGQLIEVATARVARRFEGPNFFGLGPGGLSVTSDGRWFADVVDGEIVVVDLNAGTTWPTGVGALESNTLFIEGQDP